MSETTGTGSPDPDFMTIDVGDGLKLDVPRVEAFLTYRALASRLAAALRRLDETHLFEHTIATEDWGLYEDAAIPEIREVYQQALAALTEARAAGLEEADG